MSEQICRNCRWWILNKHLSDIAKTHNQKKVGDCTRNAPNGGFGFATMYEDKSCGDFEVTEKENAD